LPKTKGEVDGRRFFSIANPFEGLPFKGLNAELIERRPGLFYEKSYVYSLVIGVYDMTLPELLDSLDAKIRMLKQEYERYFMGILKREPLIHRKEIEGLILHYTNMTIKNTGDQFKLNCLMSRYNSYRQYWTRTLRAIEEGLYTRRAESGLIASVHPSMALTGTGGAMSGSCRPEAAVADFAAAEDLSLLYNEYIEARKRHNITVKGLSKEKFLASVNGVRERIAKTYDVSDTEVTIIEKDGQVKLVIKPAGGKVK